MKASTAIFNFRDELYTFLYFSIVCQDISPNVKEERRIEGREGGRGKAERKQEKVGERQGVCEVVVF